MELLVFWRARKRGSFGWQSAQHIHPAFPRPHSIWSAGRRIAWTKRCETAFCAWRSVEFLCQRLSMTPSPHRAIEDRRGRREKGVAEAEAD